MPKILLNPTTTDSWKKLIVDACHENNINISDELESYLVFMLMRFTNDTSLADKVVATEYLEAENLIGKNKQNSLRHIGDSCLLFSGLFPERAYKKNVSIDYYINIGRSAYHSISRNNKDSLSLLFASLSKKFISLMDILLAMREIDSNVASLEPLLASEILSATNSTTAFKCLESQLDVNKINIVTANSLNTKH